MRRFLLSALLTLFATAAGRTVSAQVWVAIDPSGGTYTNSSLFVIVDMCSETSFLTAERFISLNGSDVTGWFAETGSAPGCGGHGVRYEGTIELSPGTNTLEAYAYDSHDQFGSATASYSLSSGGGGTSTTLTIAYADKFRDVSRCVADCFAATASYSTPSYVSLDVPRGVALLYRSDRARPVGIVEIDALDASPSSVQTYVLKLRRPDGSFVSFMNGSAEVYFTAGPGTTRLAGIFEASSLTTGAYGYTAVVHTNFSNGTSVETTIPARVMIVNGSSSPFGAGWEMAAMQAATVQSDGVMIASGDGSLSFFAECGGACQLTSPPGDFSTLHRLSNGTYERRYPDGSKNVFNSSGQLTGTRDRFGFGTNVGWSGGRVVSLTDPTGYAIQLTYDGGGKLSSISIPGIGSAWRTSTFTVWNGNLTQAVDPDNVVNFSATYTDNRLVSLTDRRQGSWSYTYSSDRRINVLTAPEITVGGSRPETHFAGPSRALLTAIAGGGGTQSSPIAYGLDRRASVRNPRGYTTYFAVNRWGSPTQVDYPLGPSATAQYHATTGQITQTVSASSHTINYTWNGVQLTRIQDVSAGRTIDMAYESTYNRPTSITGHTVSQTFTYPDLRTITVTQSNHPATTIKLDIYGRDSLITDPGGHQTRFFGTRSGLYNTDSVKAVGRTWYRRDNYGRVNAMVGPDNVRDSVTYDVLDRVVASTNGLNHTTSFAFGDNVFLTAVTDANGYTTSFTRNALGWVLQESRPGSANPLYTAYDVNGNVTSTTNRRGQTVSYVYDALDRMTSRSGWGIPTTTFSYALPTASTDGYIAAANGESTDTLFYNSGDRLIRSATWRHGDFYRLAYDYNSLGLRSAIHSTSGSWTGMKSQTFGFNATGALNSFTAWGASTGLNPSATNEDLATAISYPTGLTLSRSFGALHQSYKATYSNSTVQSWLGHDVALATTGQLSSITGADNAGRIFSYDGARRLQRIERWTMGGQSCPENGELAGCTWTDPQFQSATDFSYDAVGNLLNGVTQLDGAGNRVRAAKGYTFNYDADGNLTSKSGSNFTQTLAWNALGELTSVTTNGVTVEFAYDGFGRRVRHSVVGGSTTRYLHDGDNLFMQLDADGNVAIEYAYWGLDRPHAMQKGGQTYYFARDPMGGSVQALVRESDQIPSIFRYSPFGELEQNSDGVGMPLRFAGREYDAQTGLYYNRARYYDPLIGRFISEDPLGLDGGINLYAYAANDPVNSRDPYGLNPECPDKDKALTECPQELPPVTATEPRTDSPFSPDFGNPCARGGTCLPRGPGAPTAPPRSCGFACGKGASGPPPPFKPFTYDQQCIASLAVAGAAVLADVATRVQGRNGGAMRRQGEVVHDAGRLGRAGGSVPLGQHMINAGKSQQRAAVSERFAFAGSGAPPNSIFGAFPIAPGFLTLDALIGVGNSCTTK